MSKITKRYETKLETAESQNIGAILDAKLEATSPERVTDYVSFAVDNLQAGIDRVKQAESELKELKASMQDQIDLIKIGTAEWLTESGIDKLSGDIVSSMKVTQPKETKELIVTNEESLINAGYFKTTLDKTAVKNAIENGVEIEGASIEITHNQNSLSIFKKRK